MYTVKEYSLDKPKEEEMKPVIYVDMDGVITDFIEGLLWFHNRGDLIEKYEHGLFPNDWMLGGELGDEDAIWKPVRKGGEYFWTNLNPYDWTKDVIQEVVSTGWDWYICTTPDKTPECYSGKVKWLDFHLGIKSPQIITMKDKWRLAHKNAYLIDDNDTNCKKFTENGGNAYLFPQPWNQNRNNLKQRLNMLHYLLKGEVAAHA